MNTRSVAFCTLGCKLNQFESAQMAGQMADAGFKVVRFDQLADIYVINTCTVTHKGDHRCRAAIRKAQRKNASAAIVVAGCGCQVAGETYASIPGVTLILGNRDKMDIAAILKGLGNDRDVVSSISPHQQHSTGNEPMIDRFFDYSRAFVKVQEGCDSQCAYCIIPRARGPNRSMKPDWVIEQVQRLVEAGYQEIVLCGTHLGTYGSDLNEALSLAALLRRMLDETGVRRVRLSSIEPREFTDELIEEIASETRICRHLHIPLQSGCDSVLCAMNRDYTTADYSALIKRLKRGRAGICIGADVIVGFPAELNREFELTSEFIQDLDLSYLHVFSYSTRPGTPAAEKYRSSDLIPSEEIKSRSKILRGISSAKRHAFCTSEVGSKLDVLVLKKIDEKSGRRLSLSDNYINVLVDADASFAGQIIDVELTSFSGELAMGERTSVPY